MNDNDTTQPTSGDINREAAGQSGAYSWETMHPAHDRDNRIALWKDIAAIAQSIATIVAAVVAAWWFLAQGLATPHGNLTPSVQTLKIHKDWRLIRFSVRFNNVGTVPISLDSGEVSIARVLPLDYNIRRTIDAGDSPIDPEQGEIPWPSIGRSIKVNPKVTVWPGESEIPNFDFLVPADLCEVLLFARFGSSVSHSGWSWSQSTLQKVGECDDEH